ncbi:MAG: lysophospholipid acyltransferase family protein [Bacteroidota bacterium]
MSVLLQIALSLIRFLPPKWLIRIVYLTLLFTKYRKQVINNNYNSTIDSISKPIEFDQFYSKCLYNIARIMVETVTLTSSHTKSIAFTKIDEIERRCAENNGLILMASHYGNWELACITLPKHTSIPCYGVYKPLKNKTLDGKLKKLRSQFGLQLIPMNSIARSMSENSRNSKLGIYILIGDQNPRSIQNVIWADFLGILSAFSSGVIKLHKKYKFSIAYMKITPAKSIFNYYIDFVFHKPENSSNIIKWYSQCVENQIQTNPQFWLWSHKRWKRKYTPPKE